MIKHSAEFVRRPLPVQAVQWTRGNGTEVTMLLKEKERHWEAVDNLNGGWQCVYDRHYQGRGLVRQVWINDWLVITPEAGITWMSPKRFEELYEPAGVLIDSTVTNEGA